MRSTDFFAGPQGIVKGETVFSPFTRSRVAVRHFLQMRVNGTLTHRITNQASANAAGPSQPALRLAGLRGLSRLGSRSPDKTLRRNPEKAPICIPQNYKSELIFPPAVSCG